MRVLVSKLPFYTMRVVSIPIERSNSGFTIGFWFRFCGFKNNFVKRIIIVEPFQIEMFIMLQNDYDSYIGLKIICLH